MDVVALAIRKTMEAVQGQRAAKMLQGRTLSSTGRTMTMTTRSLKRLVTTGMMQTTWRTRVAIARLMLCIQSMIPTT